MKGFTLIEILIIICIVGLIIMAIMYGVGEDSWLNKPIKDLTVKDIVILKFLFD